VIVSSGALLSGSGTVGGNVALSGTVSPGNSPGTLSVAGDMTMVAGSNFRAEIDGRTYVTVGGAGSYDRIDLTGINGIFTAAGTVSPILRGITAPANNNFVPVYGDRFRIVSTVNSTGVSGAFGSITDPVTGMPSNSRFDVIYGANFIDLTLTPGNLGTFARAYGLQNMVNAAEALDGIRPAQGEKLSTSKGQFFDGLYGLNGSQLALTLLQSSGQIHAVALGTNRSGIFSQYGRLSNISQLREPTDNLWVDVSGYNSRIGEDSFASSFQGSGGQIWLGKDVISRPNQTYGVAVGQLSSRIRDVSSMADSTSNMLALYMLGQRQAFDYDAIIGYNDSKSDIDRTISLASGTVKNNSRPAWGGLTVQAGLGYAYELASGVFGRAYSRVAIDQTNAKSFDETGSSLTALTATKQKYMSEQLTVGYDFNGRITSPNYKDVNWRIGAGSTFLGKGRDAFVDRSVSMHGATWSVSEASYTSVIPFVQMSVNQRINDKMNFILSYHNSRVGNMMWRNSGYVGVSYKL
jgi:dUTP pyrophosphatase